MSVFPYQVYHLVKLKFRDCLYRFWTNQLLYIYLHRW